MSKLNEHIRDIEEAIQTSPLVRSYRIQIDQKTEHLALIKGEAHFSDGSVLDFTEFVAADRFNVEKYKYAYNYRSHEGLIFRYDNASDPRAKKLPSFPHHVHLSSGEIAKSSPKTIDEILDLIETITIKNTF